MRRVFLVAVMVIGLIGVAAAAQCGCDTPTAGSDPDCYTGYWLGVDVSFKLVVPAEYFSQCPVPDAPLITGWRVETLSSDIVYQVQFPDVPKGHYLRMVWDQTDGHCNRVAPGFYRLVVQTANAGEFEGYVHIIPWPGSWGWCNCCCRRLDTHPCCPEHVPYVEIAPCKSRPSFWPSFSIQIKVGLGTPADGSCGCP